MKNQRNMLKKSFTIFCLLLFAFSVSGQEESQGAGSKIQFGVKIGTTLSSFSSEQPHNNYKPGLIAGGFFSYGLTSNLALQTEPSYMQQGGNLIEIMDPTILTLPDYPFSAEIRDHRITYHNIDIPILLKYKRNIKGLNVFGLIGPTISMNFNTTAQTRVSARSWDSTPSYIDFYSEENITDNIEFLHYGATAGVGFEAPIGKHILIFDLKYRYSINKTYLGYSYLGIHQVQGDLSSNTFYFTLGFGF